MISVNEKVLVITRRFFEKDVRRHFIGVVTDESAVAIRVEGYVHTYDEAHQEFTRLDELRTRIISFSDNGMIIVILPPDVDIHELKYQLSPQNKRLLTDGKNFAMNVVEFGAHR